MNVLLKRISYWWIFSYPIQKCGSSRWVLLSWTSQYQNYESVSNPAVGNSSEMSNYWIAAVGNFAALGNFATVGNFATASMPLGQCSAEKKKLIKNIIDSLSFFIELHDWFVGHSDSKSPIPVCPAYYNTLTETADNSTRRSNIGLNCDKSIRFYPKFTV